jgi:hypothetical protein
MLARVDGVLQATINQDGTACLFVGNTAMIWPQGFALRGDPLTLSNASGSVVAVVGQQISLGGGLAGDGVHALGCPASIEPWIVGTVIGE